MERCVEMYCTDTVEWVQPLTTKSQLAYRKTGEFKARLAIWPEDLRTQMTQEEMAHLCDKHMPLYRGALGVAEEDLQDAVPYDASKACSMVGCVKPHTHFVGIVEALEGEEERIAGSPVCEEHVETVTALIVLEEPEAEIRVKEREARE